MNSLGNRSDRSAAVHSKAPSILTAALRSVPGDVRHAVRSLAKSPGFSLLALLTLALGIGANTATFSIVDAVLLKRLPYPQADRLVAVAEISQSGQEMAASWANFVDWQARSRQFEFLAAHTSGPSTILGGDRPLVAEAAWVSRDFFTALGVAPRLGRAPRPEEHRLGALPVAVVSERFFVSELGGDAKALGRQELESEGRRYRVIGVMPQGFGFPAKTDAWFPLELEELSPYRTAHNFQVVGRLKESSTVDGATRELAEITSTIEPFDARDDREYLAVSAKARSLHEAISGEVRRPLWILLGASALVLLIACANLASGLLARGAARQDEMAVRRALGASVGRLLGQLLTESLLLAFAGAALGLLLGRALVATIPRLAPSLPRLGEVGLDLRVLAFTFGAALLTALLFGLVPGLRLARGRQGAQALGGGRNSADAQRQRSWQVLVGAEVALALVLAVCSGLLLRSLGQLLHVELGFEPRGVTTARIDLPPSRYPEAPNVATFYEGLLQEIETAPGVEAAGVISSLPLSGQGSNGQVKVTGGVEETADIEYRVASRGYFAAMEIPVVRGETFSAANLAGDGHVVVIDRRLADSVWRGRDPIGQRIHAQGMDEYFDTDTWATVIGVVGEVRDRGLSGAPRPTVYFALAERPRRAQSASLVVRGKSSEVALGAALRAAVTQTDPEVPVEIASMRSTIDDSVRDRRFTMVLLSGFAAVALVLAMVGIAGVVAYTVAQRRRELAVRLALGAEPSGVRRFVLRHSLTAVGFGLAVGLVAALGAARLLRGLLFQIGPADPTTFVSVSALLVAAAAFASYLAAGRTLKIEPMRTLRGE